MEDASPSGVEKNAAGRFVDFTCSTDWEKAVLHVENFIRSVMRRKKNNNSELLKFGGTKLKISHHSNIPVGDRTSRFPSLFDIDSSYIIVSRPGNNWLDCTTSQRHTLFSVLVTALQSCSESVNDGISSSGSSNRVPPIFFTMANEDAILQCSRVLDIMGYQIYKTDNGSIIVNYKSINQNNILLEEGQEEFRHIDSLSQLFLKELRIYHSNIDTTEMAGNIVVQAAEQSSMKIQSDTKLISKDNLLSLSPDKSYAFPSLPTLIEKIKLLNGYSMSGTEHQIAYVTLSAELQYPPMKLIAVVDNENYTTLVPARQSPFCWSICVTFPHFFEKENLKESTPLNVTIGSNIRQLMAFFIHSKSKTYLSSQSQSQSQSQSEKTNIVTATSEIHLFMSDQTMKDTDKDKNQENDKFSFEKSVLIAAILSSKSVKSVEAMCSATENNE